MFLEAAIALLALGGLIGYLGARVVYDRRTRLERMKAMQTRDRLALVSGLLSAMIKAERERRGFLSTPTPLRRVK